MSSVLDQVAAEAVQRAINIVAVDMVKDASSGEGSRCRYLVQNKIEQLMKEPEIEKRLRAKLIEIIDGLPNSLPKTSRY